MAKLEYINTDVKIESFNKIAEFLAAEGIELGTFPLTPQAIQLASQTTATDEERAILLATYEDLKSKYSGKGQYRSDVVFLHPGFPHYEMLLVKFGDIHFHYENEYWYFFGGHFDFGFLGLDGRKFYVTVSAGEYLSVPEGKWQWLRGTVQQQMKAMRFFNSSGTYSLPLPLTIQD
jgi:1,2-dihydroxy-3-keto-5-methylthiopentene dioxygenase